MKTVWLHDGAGWWWRCLQEMQEEEGEGQLCRSNTTGWDAFALRLEEEVILWEVGEAIPGLKDRFLLGAGCLLRCQILPNPHEGCSKAPRPDLFHSGTSTNPEGSQTQGWHFQ